jgi:hypothetical protein
MAAHLNRYLNMEKMLPSSATDSIFVAQYPELVKSILASQLVISTAKSPASLLSKP